MIDCSTAVSRLWDYIERELAPDDHGQIEEHLAFCRKCCGEVEFTEHLREFLKDAARPHLPPDSEERLTRFIAEIEETRP